MSAPGPRTYLVACTSCRPASTRMLAQSLVVTTKQATSHKLKISSEALLDWLDKVRYNEQTKMPNPPTRSDFSVFLSEHYFV